MVTLQLGVIDGVPDIFTLDPGETSGWAYYSSVSGKVECGQLGPKVHHNELLTLIEYYLALSVDNRLELVFETFEFRQNEDVLRRALRKFIAELRTGEKRSLKGIIDRLAVIAEMWPSRDRLVLDSREYIGVAFLATQRNVGVSLVQQSPSEALSFIGDQKLEALGWYYLTAGLPHARDALRHLQRRLVVGHKVKAPITTAWFRTGPKITFVNE